MPPRNLPTQASQPKQQVSPTDILTMSTQNLTDLLKINENKKDQDLIKEKLKIQKIIKELLEVIKNFATDDEKIKLNEDGKLDIIKEVAGKVFEAVVLKENVALTILPKTLDSLKLTPNLDSTFENKDFHTINMKPLTHEQALTNYENSGGKTWIWDKLKTEMPYTPQQSKQLDVVSLQFPDPFERTSENITGWMTENKLRPLTYEEHIEYITTHPEHQEEKHLISLGTKHMLGGVLRVPDALLSGDERYLSAGRWSSDWDADDRFLAVPVRA